MKRVAPKSIDAYLAAFPRKARGVLETIRLTIRKAAPAAAEKISYGIPCFTLGGRPMIYFAGFQKHVSLYPAPRGSEEFKDELAAYKGGKGTVQFPLDRPIPLALVRRIAKFRIKKTLDAAKSKSSDKRKKG